MDETEEGKQSERGHLTTRARPQGSEALLNDQSLVFD